LNAVVNHDDLDYMRYFPDALLQLHQFGVVLFCRVEGISASSTRVALACGFILAVTRTGVLNPGRAQAVVPLGEMLQVQQLPPAVIRSPADSPAARRVVCMAALGSSRVASCSRGRRGARA
jgi:hypothetical protein